MKMCLDEHVLEDMLTSIISGKEREALSAAEITGVLGLLEHFPRRYEDRRRFDMFPTQAGGDPVCLRAEVVDSVRAQFVGRGKFHEMQVSALGANVFGGQSLTCRWFNMPFISKVFAAGQQVVLFGRVKESGGRLVIDHPDFEIIHEGDQTHIHVERIVPIYPNIKGINQRRLREIIWSMLEKVSVDAGSEMISGVYDIDPTYPRSEALKEIHFPDSLEQVKAAERYFAFEEFFILQLKVAWQRKKIKSGSGRNLAKKKQLLADFYTSLPFDLTGAQKRSVKEIISDMREESPMNRLLQGDVGSGKTFVAMCAMLLAVENDAQAAMMAPTQILAEQHYQNVKKWFDRLGVKVGLLTGSNKEVAPDVQVLIGTHALLYKQNHLENLGLIVIDEQHKFGVDQREMLVEKGKSPDVLVMTATPIPRSLTLTVYGDLDVSIIDELPTGRGKISTGVRVKPKVNDVKQFLKDQLEEGRQAYIVYPLVEESEKMHLSSAVVEHEKWQKQTRTPCSFTMQRGTVCLSSTSSGDVSAEENIKVTVYSSQMVSLRLAWRS